MSYRPLFSVIQGQLDQLEIKCQGDGMDVYEIQQESEGQSSGNETRGWKDDDRTCIS